MVKGHLPCSPTGYCSNSCSSSSCKFWKLSAPNESHLEGGGVNVTPGFKAKPNAHSMCVKESSLHTYHIENGNGITNVII
jgi:hypothetical protein